MDVLLLFFLQAKLPERGIPEWGLGIALLFMEMGGIVGSKLILKAPKAGYRCIFAISSLLVLTGFLAEHSAYYGIMAIGGFIAAVGDDAGRMHFCRICSPLSSVPHSYLWNHSCFPSL